METIIFIMFCCLGMYIMSLAEKRYNFESILEEMADENVKLKYELEVMKEKMGE